MNILRLLMLGGGLGRIWATSRTTRNIAQSVSLLAYFKLMDNIERGYAIPNVVIPTIIRSVPPPPPKEPSFILTRKSRMEHLSKQWKQLNHITNGN